MNLEDMLALGCLMAKWQFYLLERGHRMRLTDGKFNVWKSRVPANVRYRWLLLISGQATLRLDTFVRSCIRRHLKQAKAEKEKFYLVVGFLHEPARIVVLPAVKALRNGFVRSNKGGIAW